MSNDNSAFPVWIPDSSSAIDDGAFPVWQTERIYSVIGIQSHQFDVVPYVARVLGHKFSVITQIRVQPLKSFDRRKLASFF